MKSIFKATAILSSSSAVTVVVGLVTSKIWAVLVGPAGVGYLATTQSLLALIVMIAGFGINTGIVQAGAKAIADSDEKRLVANQKAAILLGLLGGLFGILLLVIFGDVINRIFLDAHATHFEVALLGLALIFTLLANVLIGILNAHHKIKSLAKVAILNSVLGSTATIASVWLWHTRGIFIGVIAAAIINCAGAYFFTRREVPRFWAVVERSDLIETVRSLLRFGAPYTASMIVGSGVVMILPSLILHELGMESVGNYRAAANISVTSLSFFLASITQDYYPRLSAASDDAQGLQAIINEQLSLAIVLLLPILLGLLYLSPVIIPILYSSQFVLTPKILNWMLLGDVFKVLSYMFSFVILARSKSSLFFLIELFGGVVSLSSNLLGMHFFGAEGLGISYLTTFLLYYFLVWFLVRRQIGFQYTRRNKLLILFTLVAAGGISFLTAFGGDILRHGFAITVSAASVFFSVLFLAKEFSPKIAESAAYGKLSRLVRER